MPKNRISRINHIARFSVLLTCASATQGMELDTGNNDLVIRWDNTVRYNLGVRAEARDTALANNATYDESDYKFDRGDVVTNRLDLLSEFELAYKRDHGFRVSAAGWYDQAYADSDVETNPGNVFYPGAPSGPSTPSYAGGRYSPHTDRYHNGPSGELLDAFAFTRFYAGDAPVSLRAGRHTLYWGNGLLIPGHATSYSQAPLDGRKAVTNPGTETREIFLPLTQVSGQVQLTDRLSVAAQYFLEWEPTRAAEGGTYLASADVALEGPEQLPVAPGFAFPITDPVEPDDTGNWGVMARYGFDFLHSDISVFYREFDDYTPWGLQTGASFARYVYAENTKLYGLSWSAGPVLGGASVGVDLSYRKDAALTSSNFDPVTDEGARGNTWHLIANSLWLLPSTALFDTGTLITEVAYSHLDRVTQNQELFRGEGYTSCQNQDKDWGCATRNYAGVAVNFTPQWLTVMPGLNVSAPMSISYGVSGNAAAGGGNEDDYNFKVGIEGVFDERYELSLSYIGYGSDAIKRDVPNVGNTVVGGNGSIGIADRDWVSLSFSTAF